MSQKTLGALLIYRTTPDTWAKPKFDSFHLFSQEPERDFAFLGKAKASVCHKNAWKSNPRLHGIYSLSRASNLYVNMERDFENTNVHFYI